MTAPLQIRSASFPPAGFSTAPPVRAWAAWCGPCGHGEHSLLIGRSARLDRAGWDTCMAAAHAHATQHTNGGRL
ncbi:hypothetical protein RI578_06575 [Streptomyces sp. BB1-1-1]|uniref:hypothetical protein n=1 Tax=Streptomyces sp. BB1-1-1 TaxID=3074430 RepID=UPI002877FD72|nr:hypothetical protein [Streptomyces sp. BB1-1-1]WND33978.1 hypothetical protein RI578_06575 [Streptomyces sp. BB1-1-1]